MMIFKKNFYYNLLHKFPEDIPSLFESQIDLDLGRTYPKDPFFKKKRKHRKIKKCFNCIYKKRIYNWLLPRI